MSDFDVTFSNDNFDVTLDNNQNFDVTFASDDFSVDFAIQGRDGTDGVQGSYYVKLFVRATSQPSSPTDVTWTPGTGRGTLSGTNATNWSLTVPTGSAQLWEIEALFNPADDESNITSWSAAFHAGAEGPAGPSGVTPDIRVAATTLGEGESATVVRTGDNDSPTITFGIPRGNTGPAGSAGAEGPQGDPGAAGVGITSITTGAGTTLANGNIRYTANIVYTDNSTGSYTFEAPRGQTGAAGTSPNDSVITIGGDVTANSTFSTNQSAAETISLSINDNTVDASALDVSGNGGSGQHLVSAGDGGFNWVNAPVENTFNDTANNGTTLGVDFTNSSGTITATVDASGISGGGSSIPAERARLSLNHTTFEQNSAGNTVVTATISVDSPYTFAGTGSLNGTAGNDTVSVVDGDGNAITISNRTLTSSTFSFTVSATEKQSLQTIRATATAYATYNGSTHSQGVSADIRILAGWFSGLRTSVPSNNDDLTDNGVFGNNETVTFTATSGGTAVAYIALPTRTGGYTFKSGELFLNSTTITTGYTQSGYTLYRIDDFINGSAGTLIVTVAEA